MSRADADFGWVEGFHFASRGDNDPLVLVLVESFFTSWAPPALVRSKFGIKEPDGVSCFQGDDVPRPPVFSLFFPDFRPPWALEGEEGRFPEDFVNSAYVAGVVWYAFNFDEFRDPLGVTSRGMPAMFVCYVVARDTKTVAEELPGIHNEIVKDV